MISWTWRRRCVATIVATSVTILVAWADENRFFVKLKELAIPSLTT